VHGLARQRWRQRVGVSREAAIASAGRLIKTGRRADQNTAARTVGHHLSAAEQPVNSLDRLKSLSVEAEDSSAGIGPKRAVGCNEQAMDFGGARQSFRLPGQPKTRAVVPVQTAFGSGPDIAGTVLSERHYGLILEPFRGSVKAETVLLSNGGVGKCQRDHDRFAEAMPHHLESPSFGVPTFVPESRALETEAPIPK
jgi:hypothetical protein